MRKVSKSAILIITLLVLSMIPVVHADISIRTDAPTEGTRYHVGETIVVMGDGVTSGATINLYWDFVNPAGLVNNTLGNPDGSYEVSVDIPETPAGSHYLWVKDLGTTLTSSRRVVVLPEVDCSVSFGLVDESVDVDGTGFLDEDDIYVYFGTPPVFLVESGDSTADWATDPDVGGTEDVVKLVGDAGSDARAAVLQENWPTMDTITLGNLGFDYYAMAGAAGVPELELTFVHPDCVNPYDDTSANRAHVQMTIATPGALTTGAWTTSTAITGAETVWVFGNEDDGTPFGPIIGNWATVVTGIKAIDGTAGGWVLTRVAPQAGWGVTGTYYIDYITVEAGTFNLTSPTDTLESNTDGSWSTTIDVPDLPIGAYVISGVGSGDFWNHTGFTIGAVIEISESEGPTGLVITVDGRGWTDGETISFDLDGTVVRVVDDDVITVESDGTFTADVIIPDKGALGEYTLQATETGGVEGPATEVFEVTGLPEIEVSPTFGPPGTGVTVTGVNFTQIAGTEVTITLNTTTVTGDTLADGTFTASITAPATEFRNHDVDAVDEYGVNATDTFKIGLIAMLINPTSGPSGTEVSVTGIGFTDGTYNLTFGDDLLLENEAVTSEQISDDFVVPSVEPGTYSVTVIDEDENELTASFTVTATTSLAGTPSDIAVGYNMSIYGEHFTEVDGTVLTFYAYNSTWGMTTAIVVNETFGVVSTVTEDGNFTGYWVAPEELLLGNTYTMNVTDANDLYAEFDFVIVEEEVEINPNKASYSLGDTITFTIKATFAKANSYLEIVDPSNEQIFISTFAAIEWEEISGWQVVRIPNQVQDGSLNPLMIPSDGDTGTWVWTLYDVADDVIKNGTIEILPTTAAQVDARLSDVEGSIADLAGDIAGVTSDLEDDIDALSSEIGDVASDVDGLKDEIVGDLADDIAAATDAGNAASDAVADLEDSLSDLEDSMGDIADASNSALDAAQEAADAAADAATAAEGAGDAAKGLTSLVYGAIGASLIAALAAIVSLMQISKKIAG